MRREVDVVLRVALAVLLMGAVGCKGPGQRGKKTAQKKASKKAEEGAPEKKADPEDEAVRKAGDASALHSERVDSAYARCLVRFGTGTCRLIEQHGISRCYRPEIDAEAMRQCFADMVAREYVEDYHDDCYPHVVGCTVGSETCAMLEREE